MENRNYSCLNRRIGSTNYKVKIFFSEDAAETFEDKLIRLIANRMVTLEELYGQQEENPKGAA